MDQKETQDLLFTIFSDTEQFLHNLDPKRYAPPFITTTFNKMRTTAFDTLTKDSANLPKQAQQEKILLFISKFESEYVEILRSKLRERYIDYILQKHYEIPKEINIKEVESFGAISELAQLAIAIAEWTLELEISAYTLEGLELYGLLEKKEKKREDYFKQLKKEYEYKEKGTIASMSQYIFRRFMDFTCGKIGSIALAKGMSRGGFQGKDIADIVITIVNSSKIPWGSVVSSFNLPWVAGGFVCQYFMQKLNDYAVRKEVLSNMSHIQETFETQKLHLMTERRTILDLVEKALSEGDSTKYKWELEVLAKTVRNVLEPAEDAEGKHKEGLFNHLEEKDKMFKVKEDEDFVVVEEKEFKEEVDKSGVLVVDW